MATANRPPISQNPDIRYLGRLLGGVIRTYGGERLYRQTEYIRSASVDRARGIAAGAGTDTGLSALTLDDTLAFVRGFMLFSMLANLAEDRQGVAKEEGADVASAIQRLEGHGISEDAILALLEKALVVPVLTAHPTEVRRKSMIDHRNIISDLMVLRDKGATETADGEPIDEAITRQIALLWQTRPIRRERLYVRDEIDNALSYFRDIFMPVLPGLYARWDRVVGKRVPGFLRLGTWIGGDRDGNPCAWRSTGPADRPCASISRRCTSWARSSPSPRSWRRCPRRCAIWRRRAAMNPPAAATSPIAARSPASMAGSRRPMRR
jgi:phosphoenolpyruvate carboxylase